MPGKKLDRTELQSRARAAGKPFSGTVAQLRERLGMAKLKARKKRPSRARKVGETPICSAKKFAAAKCKSPYETRDQYGYGTYKTGDKKGVKYCKYCKRKPKKTCAQKKPRPLSGPNRCKAKGYTRRSTPKLLKYKSGKEYCSMCRKRWGPPK